MCWPDRVLNPGPLKSQVPYRLRYVARWEVVTVIGLQDLIP